MLFDRAEILRTNDDKTESLIIIELDKALDGDPANNINLKSRDVLTIKSSSEILYKTDIAIRGHVKFPEINLFTKALQFMIY